MFTGREGAPGHLQFTLHPRNIKSTKECCISILKFLVFQHGMTLIIPLLALEAEFLANTSVACTDRDRKRLRGKERSALVPKTVNSSSMQDYLDTCRDSQQIKQMAARQIPSPL